MKQFFTSLIGLFVLFLLGGCIANTDTTIEGSTPDITECTPLDNVLDGADFIPKTAILEHEADGRTHPDIFYIAWAQLDARIHLKSPDSGYNERGFEDKLMVSRKERSGTYKTWQIYPSLDNDCQDVEKVRIQSFDIAPDGRSLYIAMSKPVFDEKDTLKVNDLNPNRNLGIFKMDISSKKITPLTHDYTLNYTYPTFIGEDNETGHEMLLVSKTITRAEIPINYKSTSVLRDEYDRISTPLIHKLDTVTGSIVRIGFNNSHQTEPVVINQEGDVPLVVFTQWEHQSTVNRFSLWKMQIDGSDNFAFYGQESRTDRLGNNIYQARQIKSGKYKGSILMGQSSSIRHRGNLSEGDILIANRDNLDLRSDAVFLSKVTEGYGIERNLARTPDEYNAESFVYAYRRNVDSSYGIYVKEYPENLEDEFNDEPGVLIASSNSYHFMQPRSFYPPISKKVAPGLNTLSENRVSFTNDNLKGKSGFLVDNLAESDNGVQHQLDGINPNDIRLQFFVPSHHFDDSQTVAVENKPEMTIPSSDFIAPESDGSIGVVLKNGLYTWKINKRLKMTDGLGEEGDIWIPVRSERQEVNFVANRVNACNQCHQERNQANIDKYKNYHSLAERKMKGDLADVIGTDNDISEYNTSAEVPDFYKQIVPLLQKPALDGGKSCVDCHNAKDKLNLASIYSVEQTSMSYRNLLLGAHKLEGGDVIPYLYGGINPMGMDDEYHPAPFLWSLIFDDDLSVPPDENHSNGSSRNLDRDGDYGAKYSEYILNEIHRVNRLYDHSKHWSLKDTQTLVTYGATRLPVGLSDRLEYKGDFLEMRSGQGQKAFQSLLKNCFECHNKHKEGGIYDNNFEAIQPKEKTFIKSNYNYDIVMRLGIHYYTKDKGDSKYSQYLYQSSLPYAMERTLLSALYRVDFGDLNNSELLVYARGYYLEKDGSHSPLNSNIKDHTGYMDEGSDDYKALFNWLNGISMVNHSPVMKVPIEPIVLKEYDTPAYLNQVVEWSDPDEGELSQAFIDKQGSSEHTFNDTMLAFEYQSFTSAKLKAYAILGDRGEHNITFNVTDGLRSFNNENVVPVTITSDYNVPAPVTTLPKAYLFFTDRVTQELKKLNTNGSVVTIGKIEGFNQDWTTVYRRADKGWLYFLNQAQQTVYVVDETNASVLFTIVLDNLPNIKQLGGDHIVYLIWWRPAEGVEGEANYSAGELQGLLQARKEDYYVGLGTGENSGYSVVPEIRTSIPDGSNTIGIYVWRRATFMTKWTNESIDRMNVLNLITGKAKFLSDYKFTEKTLEGVTYPAYDYWNVRAIVVAEDGAFYGFNKDLNVPATAFNFDPLAKVQQPVEIPIWLQEYINDYQSYATPFLVIEPRE